MSTMLNSFAYPISASFLFFPGYKDWELGALGQISRLREQVRQLLYAEIRARRQYLEQPGVSPAKDRYLDPTPPGQR